MPGPGAAGSASLTEIGKTLSMLLNAGPYGGSGQVCDETGHVNFTLGALVSYSTDTSLKWPNAASGNEPVGVPGMPPRRPGPAPKLPGGFSPPPADPCGPGSGATEYENNICVAPDPVCPTCGIDQCVCEISLNPLPFQNPVALVTGWSLLGVDLVSNPATGLHAAYWAKPEAGRFFHFFHDAAANLQDFVEVHSVDGTVERYSKATVGSGIQFWRIDWSLDPQDNLTRYVYYPDGRLHRVQHPSGLDQVWNYQPPWIGDPGIDGTVWDQQLYSGIEVRWVDTATAPVDLSEFTQRILFLRPQSGGAPAGPPAPFRGDLLYRVYEGRRPVIDPVATGIYALPADLLGTPRHLVSELVYFAGTSRVQRIQRLVAAEVNGGISATAAESTPVVTNEFTYVQTGTDYHRVATETLPLEQRVMTYTYVADAATVTRVDQVTVVDSGTGTAVVRTFDDWMRVTELVVRPSASGLPRAQAGESPAEPSETTTTYVYGSCGVCAGKPTRIEQQPSGRVWEFEYDAATGLIRTERGPSPTGTGTTEVVYQWDPVHANYPYRAYQLTSVVTPDGTTTFSYQSAPRRDATHGYKHTQVVETSPAITGPNGSQPAVSSVTNLDQSPITLVDTGFGPRQTRFVGQVDSIVDGDSVTTGFTYDGFGYLAAVVNNPQGAAEQLTVLFERDRRARVLTETRHAGSAQPLVVTYQYNSLDLATRVSRTVDGIAHVDAYFYDMWGNLAAHLRRNHDGAGLSPVSFATPPSGEQPREWLRDEWHYAGARVLTAFADRRALHRDDAGAIADAADARFLRTDFVWRPDGVVTDVLGPTGAVGKLVWDGYGTLYSAAVVDSLSSAVVTEAKYYVDGALEVVKVVDGLGAATEIERNGAGFVERIVEPPTTQLPSAYPWPSAPRAAVEFDADAMGRVRTVRVFDQGGGTLLSKRELATRPARPRATPTRAARSSATCRMPSGG